MGRQSTPPQSEEGAPTMDLHGLQKLTLLDYPGKVACTVFLGGCNLRCPFCHNGELLDNSLPPQLISEELLAFLGRRRGLLDGVCITGGEPLLRPQLPQLLRRVKELGFSVKLDTNGAFPRQLKEIVGQGLVDYVAMDIKNSPERYPQTAGVPDLNLEPYRQSVSLLLEGRVDYEFRTTVVREYHDADSFRAIGPWLTGARRYFLQSFVDRDTVLQPGLHPCTREQLETFADLVRPYVAQVELRGVE